YLLQARLFATGHLSVESPPLQIRDLFEVDHIILSDGRIRSIYPPAWPALLAVGRLLHFESLVTPALASLALYLLFILVRRLLNVEVAWFATLLLAGSPLFVIHSMNYLSHLPAFCLGLVFLNLATTGWALAAGLVAGFAVMLRPS